MNSVKIRILHLEDIPTEVELQDALLQEEGFEIESQRVETRAGFIAALERGGWDIILADYSMPGFDGLSALEIARERAQDIPFVFVSGTLGEEIAIESLKHGATDYVIKTNLSRLAPVVRRALQETAERREHTRAAEQLRESEEKYRLLAENMLDFVSTSDLAGNLTYVSPSIESALGYSFAELRNLSRDVYMTQASVEEITRTLTEELVRENAGGADPNRYRILEVEYIRRDASHLICEIKSSAIRNTDGVAIGIQTIGRDITERKRAEMALRERSLLLQTSTDNASVGLVMLDSHRHYIFANQAYCKILGLGFTAEELIGKSPAEILAEVYASQISPRLDRAFAGERVTYELTRPRPDAPHGELAHYVVVYDPSRDEPGRVDGVIVTVFDITDRKRAEQTILERERQLTALVTSLDDIVFEFDEQGTYLNVWTTDESKLAQPKAQLLGRRIDDVLGQEIGRPFSEAVKRAVVEGRSETIEYPLQVIGGQRWFIARVNPVVAQDGSHRTASMLIRDITERKRAEQALRESEAQLKRAQAIAHVGNYEVRANGGGKKLHWSDEMYRIVGLTPDNQPADLMEFIQRVVHPDDRERIREATERIWSAGEKYQIEYRILRPDGAVAWVDSIGQSLLGDAGQVVAVVGTLQDITERKQAEQALRESEEKYAVTFDKSPFAIALSKMPQATLVSVNDAFLDLFELTRSEALGKTSVELGITDAESRAKVGAEFQTRGSLHDFEVSRTAKTGRRLDLALSLDWVTIGGEKHILTTIRDITDRKRAEERLRESEQRFRTAFNSSPISMGISSMQDGRFLSVNQAFLDLSGFARDEMIGHTAFELNIYSNLQDRARLIQQLTEHGRVSNLEMQIRIKSGAVRQVIAWAEKIELSGAPCILALTQDVTEQKQRERERETLLTLATALRAARTRDEMLPIILDQIIHLMNLEGAAFALREESSGESVIELARGGLETWNHLRIPPGQGITGIVMSSGETYVTNDLNTDPNNYRKDLLKGVICVACVPLIADNKTIGALWIKSASHMQAADVRLLEGVANMSATAIHRATLFEQIIQYASQITDAYEKNIEGWSRALDLRDKETEGHTRRVTELTLKLARAMNFRDADLVHIRRGALLHDIGKMGVPDHILLKPGKLTEDEWEQMRLHPVFAYELLLPIEFLHDALDIPYCHHEKWDGTGYPRGLKGEEIPLSARLFAIVDVWDALTNDRPYRPAWSKKKALAYIQEQSGTHFDSRAVEVFLKVLGEDEQEAR